MCRKKKIKCDGKLPACTHCINYKTECVFTQVEKKRNPPKGYVCLFAAEDIADVSAEPNISRVSRIDWGGWRICLDFLVCLRWIYCGAWRSEELLLINF